MISEKTPAAPSCGCDDLRALGAGQGSAQQTPGACRGSRFWKPSGLLAGLSAPVTCLRPEGPADPGRRASEGRGPMSGERAARTGGVAGSPGALGCFLRSWEKPPGSLISGCRASPNLGLTPGRPGVLAGISPLSPAVSPHPAAHRAWVLPRARPWTCGDLCVCPQTWPSWRPWSWRPAPSGAGERRKHSGPTPRPWVTDGPHSA